MSTSQHATKIKSNERERVRRKERTKSIIFSSSEYKIFSFRCLKNSKRRLHMRRVGGDAMKDQFDPTTGDSFFFFIGHCLQFRLTKSFNIRLKYKGIMFGANLVSCRKMNIVVVYSACERHKVTVDMSEVVFDITGFCQVSMVSLTLKSNCP